MSISRVSGYPYFTTHFFTGPVYYLFIFLCLLQVRQSLTAICFLFKMSTINFYPVVTL